MNIFGSILEKLGINKPAAPIAAASQPVNPAPSQSFSSPSSPTADAASAAAASAAAKAAASPMAMVDVVSKLEKLSSGKAGLDWKVSIVDLLKLLDMDSSLAARTALADELGIPADIKSDSARMNVWLHQTVLQKIAENGGNIPQSLLNK